MQAIRTRYHGATNTKQSRITASCQAGRVTVNYDHALNLDQNHRAACEALRARLEWVAPHHSPMVGGVFAGDTYWVFADSNLADRTSEG
jgi:hypothetical protein